MATSKHGLCLRLLGELEVHRGVEARVLPQSKKTRALLAYLVLSEKSHRRDRLCTLFWDVADDPRGALRWSLSKLRGLVDDDQAMRIVTDRDSVRFEDLGAEIDVRLVKEALSKPSDSLDVATLQACVAQFRGELLEGLELPDFHEFQAWLVAQREDLRNLHHRALSTLTTRLAHSPDEALPHARRLVEVDPLDEAARANLIRLLGALGRRQEAEQVYVSGSRLGEELGASPSGDLERAWRALPGLESRPSAPTPSPSAAPEDDRQSREVTALIGRQAELARIYERIDAAAAGEEPKALMLSGAVGVGKSRLLKEIGSEVRRRNGLVLEARAYEAESGRPYGPWIDAFQKEPTTQRIFAEAEAGGTRERLFGAVVESLAECGRTHGLVHVVLDDIQWLDESSAELLHFVLRTSRQPSLLFSLAAREGELFDNSSALRVVRALRTGGRLVDVPVPPLDRAETEALARALNPSVDPERVFRESAGNPLFAIELARSAGSASTELPSNLSDIVRERVDRLPPDAADLLRWASVLGHGFDAHSLERLVRSNPDALMAALELLERRALIQCEDVSRPASGYVFSHDFVRQAVYADISLPRRRLMHGRVAEMFDQAALTDGTRAAAVAHHAAMAGDLRRAAEACVRAATQCLRIYASAEAYALSRRGMLYAAEVEEPLRTRIQIELSASSYQAGSPSDSKRLSASSNAWRSSPSTMGRWPTRVWPFGCSASSAGRAGTGPWPIESRSRPRLRFAAAMRRSESSRWRRPQGAYSSSSAISARPKRSFERRRCSRIAAGRRRPLSTTPRVSSTSIAVSSMRLGGVSSARATWREGRAIARSSSKPSLICSCWTSRADITSAPPLRVWNSTGSPGVSARAAKPPSPGRSGRWPVTPSNPKTMVRPSTLRSRSCAPSMPNIDWPSF